MQKPPRPTPRETTEAMVRNIGRELAEIERRISHCRGDRVAEPRLTGTWMGAIRWISVARLDLQGRSSWKYPFREPSSSRSRPCRDE
jgi:hypothetical protein